MKLTNYQLIKEMNKEQLAEFLNRVCDCSECPCVEECVEVDKDTKCVKNFLKWLEAESDKLCFGDLKIGDKFKTFYGEYIKTTFVKSDDVHINTADLQTGNLIWLSSDVIVERI